MKQWVVRWESRRFDGRRVFTRQERFEGSYEECLRKMDKLVCVGVVETATMMKRL